MDPDVVAQRLLLEDRLAEAPDDPVAWQVYGDHLQKHGDPVGELIALALAAAAQPGGKAKPPAQRAYARAFAKHAPRLLGTLTEHGASIKDPEAPPLIWKRGVLRRVLLRGEARPNDPVDRPPAPQASRLAAILPHPAARLLGELAIHAADQADATAIVASLIEARPRLTELELYARGELGDLSALWEALPHLQQLAIGAHGFEVGELELPRLRRAVFAPLALTPRSLRAIAAAPWPALERLELRFGGVDLPPHAAMRDLAPLLARADLPALTTLKLRGAPYAGAILRAIADGPLAGQLQLLDVSGGTYNPLDLAYVAERKARFTQLRELWVASTHATLRNAEAALAGVAKHVVTRHVPDALLAQLGTIDARVLDRYRDPPDDDEDG